MIAVALSLALAATPKLAPGEERWQAMSRTAEAITGDIRLSPRQLKTARAALPLAVARDLPDFRAENGAPVAARVLRVTRPADPVLLNGNRLCGTPPVRWLAVWRGDGGRTLTMAVFSGKTLPVGLDDAGLCGTFGYSR